MCDPKEMTEVGALRNWKAAVKARDGERVRQMPCRDQSDLAEPPKQITVHVMDCQLHPRRKEEYMIFGGKLKAKSSGDSVCAFWGAEEGRENRGWIEGSEE